MPSKHALLSASSSARWLHCTPSARLEEKEEEKASAFAAEGTVAHAKAEEKLRNWNEGHPRKKVKCEDGEMDESTTAYRDYVIEVLNTERKECPDADLYIEVQLDLSPWIPEGFGTADAVVVSDKTLHVIDLKYGKGVQISAPGNSQLQLYAAGAQEEFGMYYNFEDIKVHIFQPRLDHISTAEFTTEELEAWLDNVVKPKAKEAFEGTGNQEPGDWCKFCKVKGNCRARAEKNKEIETKFKRLNALLLTDDEIAELLPGLDQMNSWIQDIKEFALAQALSGTKYNGYKVVEGTSRRKVVDPEQLQSVLDQEGFKYEDYMKEPELKTLTALEKLVGKKHFAEIAEPYIDKPEGKPTLVPETDKRPEYRSGAQEFKDE